MFAAAACVTGGVCCNHRPTRQTSSQKPRWLACLTCDVGVAPRPPLRDEHGDVPVPELPEVLDRDGDPAAGEELLQAVAAGSNETVQ